MASALKYINLGGPQEEVASQLLDTLSKSGFAYVRPEGYGMDTRNVEGMFELSKSFFDLPMEQKMSYRIGPDNRGWSAMFSEVLDPETQKHGDTKECFNIAEFVDEKPQQELPNVLAEKIHIQLRFLSLCQKLCMQLLDLVGLALRIREAGGHKWLSNRHTQPSGTVLRLLWYPAYEGNGDKAGASDLRAGAHTDYGSLTLLFQRDEQQGLEILSPEGSWSSVPVRPPGTEEDEMPPIVVNIGDLMSYWTHGLLKSATHRVVSSPETRQRDRYSIAYFCHPANDTKLTPIPSQIVADHASNGSGTNSQDSILTALGHLQKRLAATYRYD